jgi:inorganic pyrophosphatase
VEITDPTAFLGEHVVVRIDRPLGARHPRHGWIYPINYGHVPGTLSPDGAELDAYVLGVSAPCTTFEGQCIAVIVRTDNDDPKLVVVPDEVVLSDAEIRSQTSFQERFFRSRIVR